MIPTKNNNFNLERLPLWPVQNFLPDQLYSNYNIFDIFQNIWILLFQIVKKCGVTFFVFFFDEMQVV